MKMRDCVFLCLIALALFSCSSPNLSATTPSPQETSSPEENHATVDSCKAFSETGVNASGYLLAGNLRANNDYVQIDMNSMQGSQIFNTWTELVVSPASDALAFMNENKYPEQIVVVTQNEEKIIPRDNWRTLSRWADSHTLVIAQNITQVTVLGFLDPFTGELETFDPHLYFNDVMNLFPNENWAEYTYFVFSPALDYFVYPKMSPMSTELALLHAADRTLITTVGPIYAFSVPEWSPEGDRFIVAKPVGVNSKYYPEGDDLFLIRVNGEIKRLTNLSDPYPDILINFYKWSPNGEQIAFWFTPDQYSAHQVLYFAVFDIAKNRLLVSCFLTNQNIENASFPVWSPDNQSIAIELASDLNRPTHIAVLDLDRSSFQLVDQFEGITPLGWLNFDPQLNSSQQQR